MNASKWKFYFATGLIVVFYITMFQTLRLRTSNDDVFFYNALNTRNVLEFMLYRYDTWSGRFTIEGLLASTIHFSTFWKVIIPSAFILLACSISRIATGEIRLNFVLGSSALLLLVPKLINIDSFYWVTGAYNYIIPFSLATYSLSIFLKHERGLVNSSLSLVALVVAGFSEQSAVFLLLICYSLIVLKKVKISWYSIGFIILLSICSAFLFLAPGNEIRSSAESINWMPQFFEYSILLKLMFGLDRVGMAMSMPFNIPLITLCIALILKTNKKALSNYISSAIILSYVFLNFYISLKGSAFHSYFFNWLSPDLLYPWAEKFSSITGQAYLLYTMLFIVCIMFRSSLFIGGLNRSLIPLVATSCAFASIVMIGFSPTIYASYFRILYMFNICVIIATCNIIYMKIENE